MKTIIQMEPIGIVRNDHTKLSDSKWEKIISEISIGDHLPNECLDGIEEFSHLEIIFFLNKSEIIIRGSEHPKENPDWPKVGIFAQRKKDRPNHLGLTIVKLIKKEGKKIIISGLDAINGTPILDIKPVFMEYLPKGEIKQPKWSHELMKNYW